MKLSPTLLTQIAITAGITATSATPLSIASIAAAKAAGDGGCVRPAIEKVKAPKQKTAAEFFAKADSNKDGKLSKEEFDIAFKAIVAQEKAKQIRKPHPMPVIPVGPGDGCPGCGLG